MNYKIIFVLVTSLIVLIFCISFIFLNFNLVSADHIVNVSSGGVIFSVNEGSTLFNISINNTNTGDAANISQVNITLWENFNLTNGTNGASANGTFSNTSTVLTWNNTAMLINGSNTTEYFWFNASSAAGTYVITVTTLNGSTNSTTNLSVVVNDTTAPTLEFTCSPLTVNPGELITCYCEASDNVLLSGSPIYSQNPQTLVDAGTYQTTCYAYDNSSNEGLSTVTYIVSSAGSNVAFGGTTPTSTFSYTKTIDKNEKEFSQMDEFSKELNARQRIKIKINRINHYVGIRDLTQTSATIEITSTPQQAAFNIGNEKKFEVTNDSYNDISVTLNSIENSKANITLKYIHEEISVGGGGDVSDSSGSGNGASSSSQNTNDEEPSENSGNGGFLWLWILLWILFVIIICVVVIIIIFKKDEKVY